MILTARTGETFQISPEDADRVAAKGGWTVYTVNTSGSRYVYSTRTRNLPLHRFLLEPPEGMMVDHINGDTFDNRRENLRVCTASENSRNRKIHKNNKIGIRGVTAFQGGFRADITHHGRRFMLGTFPTIEEAAAARKGAEMVLWSEEDRGMKRSAA